jgi:hypothetical protein
VGVVGLSGIFEVTVAGNWRPCANSDGALEPCKCSFKPRLAHCAAIRNVYIISAPPGPLYAFRGELEYGFLQALRLPGSSAFYSGSKLLSFYSILRPYCLS